MISYGLGKHQTTGTIALVQGIQAVVQPPINIVAVVSNLNTSSVVGTSTNGSNGG